METKIKSQAIIQTAVTGQILDSNPSGNRTITSSVSEYVNQSWCKQLDIKNGGLILCIISCGGIYCNAPGQDIFFEVGMDGKTTKANSGGVYVPYLSYSNDGTKVSNNTMFFFFTGVTPGTHIFYPLVSSGSGSVIFKQYAQNMLYVAELQSPIG